MIIVFTFGAAIFNVAVEALLEILAAESAAFLL
jgi:hypothetical protein